MVKVKTEAEIHLPAMPNFLSYGDASETGKHRRIDVADIDDSGLNAIGEEWTAALLAHAKRRRAARLEEKAKATPPPSDAGASGT